MDIQGRDGALQSFSVEQVSAALSAAGVEVYRTNGHEVQIAERVRFHIMDSGVRVRVGSNLRVHFTARSQRSDFPHDSAAVLFKKVRDEIHDAACARGFEEDSEQTVEVKDPMDRSKVLDVWHEIAYARSVSSIEDAVTEVQWALGLEKYVAA